MRANKKSELEVNEKLLQFIWQFQYFQGNELRTVEGEVLEILNPGQLNRDQGPDFLNAQVRIVTTVFAGSVELHCKTSQWLEHGHSGDNNYRNVILHVVFRNDLQSSPLSIPVLELENRISYWLVEKYQDLMQTPSLIACSGNIDEVNELVWMKWKERLVAQRLFKKSEKIIALLESNHYNWQEAFWWMLARSFGTKVNADAFEAIARSLPLNIMIRHRNQIHHLEALLLGQANLLHNRFQEDYPKLLSREYFFLRKKYNLRPSSIPVHFLRMRPGNFPSLRLAQLAMLVQEKGSLMPAVLQLKDIKEVRNYFSICPNDYWLYHYVPDEPATFRRKNLGKDTIDHIIINTIAPFLFCYGRLHRDHDLQNRAIDFLHQTEAEHNAVTKSFSNLGVTISNAFHSQALLELKSGYCDEKRCLQCAVGYQILRSSQVT